MVNGVDGIEHGPEFPPVQDPMAGDILKETNEGVSLIDDIALKQWKEDKPTPQPEDR